VAVIRVEEEDWLVVTIRVEEEDWLVVVMEPR
jgi:hypothetical protein